jgi:hypothetical protein
LTGEERRRHPRVVVDLPVRLRIGDRTVPGRLHDVCLDAALVETHERCAVGERVALAWESPGGGMAEVDGVVLRISPGEGDARRAAILFVDVAPAAATAIELLVDRAGTGG